MNVAFFEDTCQALCSMYGRTLPHLFTIPLEWAQFKEAIRYEEDPTYIKSFKEGYRATKLMCQCGKEKEL